jgi:integrase
MIFAAGSNIVAIPTHSTENAVYRLLVLVALHTGLQFDLRWEDIDLLQKTITVRESKAGEARRVRVNKVVIHTLQSLPRMINNPYVFYVCRSGDCVKDLRKLWDKWMREARIENFRWHDLRHTFASRLVMAGVHSE